jgi:hypothetical protein
MRVRTHHTAYMHITYITDYAGTNPSYSIYRHHIYYRLCGDEPSDVVKEDIQRYSGSNAPPSYEHTHISICMSIRVQSYVWSYAYEHMYEHTHISIFPKPSLRQQCMREYICVYSRSHACVRICRSNAFVGAKGHVQGRHTNTHTHSHKHTHTHTQAAAYLVRGSHGG